MAGGGTSSKYDVNLNLAPVVDCMIVLISFLLMGASMVSIVLLETTVPAVVLEARERSIQEKDLFRLKLTMQQQRLLLSLRQEDKQTKTWKLDRDRKSGKFPLQKLHQQLVTIKKEHPDRFAIDFTIKGELPYGEIVEIIEATKKLNKEDPEIFLKDEKQGKEVKLVRLFPDIHWTELTQ
jgi:biopolymer transport protein ExbD